MYSTNISSWMPRAVVMHHRQHRKPMMLGRPQHTWRVVQIAVVWTLITICPRLFAASAAPTDAGAP
jgi:hypothetical protein